MVVCAFVRDRSLPSRDRWQRAIDALSLPITLADDFDPASADGFQPCTVNGDESGVEVFHMPLEEALEDVPAVAPHVRGTNHTLAFRFGGDAYEAAAALAMCASLLSVSDCVIWEEGSAEPQTKEQLVAEAKQFLTTRA